MPNRLDASTSPYLLQHQDNPVDWYEWGDEAFEAAQERDVPILLSVGYAACHWCHVMAHESFEDPLAAEEMNDRFVNVKVDREERPDVDATYMEAVQALTGQGGWPMTAFLTPAGRVFHAGTYFPPNPRPGMPGFRQVLRAVSEAWAQQREQAVDAGERIAQALSQRQMPPGAALPDDRALVEAVTLVATEYDARHGGFGGAPKFPPSQTLLWLLRHAARTGSERALDLAAGTLRAMAHSGTYDQVEGGFARYAVDAAWVVPHFEKMLYDNALLARAYLHWWRLTGDPLGARVAIETCDFMLARLGTEQGGLASSLDADTPDEHGHGVEGLTYVWTPAQLVELLGEDDGGWAAGILGVTDRGTFEHGTSTLRVLRPLDGPEADPDDVRRWTVVRRRLAQARAERPQPGRDDKVVAAWNGLAVAALAETGALLDRPDLVDAARRVATVLVDLHVEGDGRLRRVSRDGVAGRPAGVLEDHGDVAEGLLALFAVTGETRWYETAGSVLAQARAAFHDLDAGSWHDTPVTGTDPRLLDASGRPRTADPAEGPHPSGLSALAGALTGWAALTGDTGAREDAESLVRATAAVSARAPRFAGWALAVAEALVDGPREVAVVGEPGTELHRVSLRGNAPGLVVAVGAHGATTPPLLSERPAGPGGVPLAYPCRGMVCDLPTGDAGTLGRWVLVRQDEAHPTAGT